VLARTAAGNITLFAFDAGEELSEHTAPFDALVLTLSGALVLTIGGRDVQTTVLRQYSDRRANQVTNTNYVAGQANSSPPTTLTTRFRKETQNCRW
jgi:hypothetical protein